MKMCQKVFEVQLGIFTANDFGLLSYQVASERHVVYWKEMSFQYSKTIIIVNTLSLVGPKRQGTDGSTGLWI